MCGLQRAVERLYKQIILSVVRSKKVSVKCAKDELKMLALSSEISPEDVCELFNVAAQFMGKFLSLQQKFLGEASSEDSTGTITTDDDEHLHGHKFDAPPKSPDVREGNQQNAVPTSQNTVPHASTSKVEYVYTSVHELVPLHIMLTLKCYTLW